VGEGEVRLELLRNSYLGCETALLQLQSGHAGHGVGCHVRGGAL